MCARYDNLIAREAYRSIFKPRLPQSSYPPRHNVADRSGCECSRREAQLGSSETKGQQDVSEGRAIVAAHAATSGA